MGNCSVWSCEWRLGLQREKNRRERESAVVLSGGELDGGRRATMWVCTHTMITEMWDTADICTDKWSLGKVRFKSTHFR